MCGKCSNYSYKLDNLNKTVRVCTFCFKDLTQTAPNSVSTLPSSDSFENLSEFISNLTDSSSPSSTSKDSENKGHLVTIKVKRINASDKGLQLMKGKAIVPHTRKANRRVLYNITSAVVNEAGGEEKGGESGGEVNGTVGQTSAPTTMGEQTVADSSLPSLPPLPSLPNTSRPRLTTYAPSVSSLTNGHGSSSPRTRPLSNSSSISLDDTWKSDRKSTDSFDTHSMADTDDLPVVPNLEDPPVQHSPKQRQVVVGQLN